MKKVKYKPISYSESRKNNELSRWCDVKDEYDFDDDPEEEDD